MIGFFRAKAREHAGLLPEATFEDLVRSLTPEGKVTDVHTVRACQLFNVTEDKVTPAMRRAAKQANYASIYA